MRERERLTILDKRTGLENIRNNNNLGNHSAVTFITQSIFTLATVINKNKNRISIHNNPQNTV